MDQEFLYHSEGQMSNFGKSNFDIDLHESPTVKEVRQGNKSTTTTTTANGGKLEYMTGVGSLARSE